MLIFPPSDTTTAHSWLPVATVIVGIHSYFFTFFLLNCRCGLSTHKSIYTHLFAQCLEQHMLRNRISPGSIIWMTHFLLPFFFVFPSHIYSSVHSASEMRARTLLCERWLFVQVVVVVLIIFFPFRFYILAPNHCHHNKYHTSRPTRLIHNFPLEFQLSRWCSSKYFWLGFTIWGWVFFLHFLTRIKSHGCETRMRWVYFFPLLYASECNDSKVFWMNCI